MKLIAGLGNPGSQYQFTRHNAGFLVVDSFAEFFKINFKPGKGNWYEGWGTIDGEKVCLMKPSTYMNDSGIAVIEFLENYEREFGHLELNDVLIIVDDFQIPLGTIRFRKKGSDGGHNGLSSIIYHLNSDEFPRMRIGIGRDEIIRKDDFVEFVLCNFDKEEMLILSRLQPVYVDAIRSFILRGITKTMNEFNKSFLNPGEEPETK